MIKLKATKVSVIGSVSCSLWFHLWNKRLLFCSKCL